MLRTVSNHLVWVNWFRNPSNWDDAEYLHIWVEDKQAILCTDPSYFVSIGRTISATIAGCLNAGPPGHSETCVVQKVMIDGKETRYVDFEFVRYIINGDELCSVEITSSQMISVKRLFCFFFFPLACPHGSTFIQLKLLPRTTIEVCFYKVLIIFF